MDRGLRLLEQAIDMHVHSSPDLFQRKMDDCQLSEWIDRAGMRAAVVKGHYGDTSSRVNLFNRQQQAKANLLGSIVLNNFVGGLNPYAVETAMKMGAKVVWLPTIHALNHLRYYGGANYTAMKADQHSLSPGDGLTVVDERGVLKEEVLTIMELVRDGDVCLATGHIGNAEAWYLCEAALEMGVKRLVLTHPDFEIHRMPVEQQKELALKGCIIEKTYLPLTPSWYHASIEELAASIKEIGAESCILTSDLGQVDNEQPPLGLAAFISGLLAQGIAADEIELMVKENPARLLY
jgi:hypothetical protein